MDRHRLDGEQVVALPERLETSLVNVTASPTINVNVANVVVPQINTGVQVSVLGNSPQAMWQGNLDLTGIGQTNH